MKTHLLFSEKVITLWVFLSVFSFASNAQELNSEEGGEYPVGRNDVNNPCITPQQYQVMQQQIIDNSKMLGLYHPEQKSMMSTSFAWPLSMNNGLNDCSYYAIVNYLDQDTTPGLKDWHCGAVTYDGHRGNDLSIFPYPFYKMDNNQVKVIAAAPGTIVNKVDGNFDKNCAANNLNPNYIAVEHADGSVAIYYHMKKNSLTNKIVGQTVVAGEFLGMVGSSGNSTGPHLHFEVWANVNMNSLNDAFAGPCNLLNNNSWWANQKPYTEPNIISIQVNNINPVLPACPATETPNFDSCFVAPGTAKFIYFIRNETTGLIAHFRIVNPNNTTFSSWTHNSNNNYIASYYIATRTLPTIPGTYTYEAEYNGDTCRKAFKVNCAPTGFSFISELSQLKISPNPANDFITISGDGIDNGNYKFTLLNVMGQVLIENNSKIENNSLQKNISVSEFPNGIYFLNIKTENESFSKKLIIQK